MKKLSESVGNPVMKYSTQAASMVEIFSVEVCNVLIELGVKSER